MFAFVQIVAALFLDAIDVVPPAHQGGPTRLNLTGVHFSTEAPARGPLQVAPHLVVIVRCASDEPGQGALEVEFQRDGERLARNAQPLTVEPGRFSYRLVRTELEVEAPTALEAHCRIDAGPAVVVPYSILAP